MSDGDFIMILKILVALGGSALCLFTAAAQHRKLRKLAANASKKPNAEAMYRTGARAAHTPFREAPEGPEILRIATSGPTSVAAQQELWPIVSTNLDSTLRHFLRERKLDQTFPPLFVETKVQMQRDFKSKPDMYVFFIPLGSERRAEFEAQESSQSYPFRRSTRSPTRQAN